MKRFNKEMMFALVVVLLLSFVISPNAQAATNVSNQWSLDFKGELTTTPSFTSDGKLFLTTGKKVRDVYSYDSRTVSPNGIIDNKWTLESPMTVVHSVASRQTDTIDMYFWGAKETEGEYVEVHKNSVYALNGTLLSELDGKESATRVDLEDGSYLLKKVNYYRNEYEIERITKYSPTGQQQWSIAGAEILEWDNSYYVRERAPYHMKKYDSNGNKLWETAEHIQVIHAITDTHVIAGYLDDLVYVYNHEGERLFHVYTEYPDVFVAQDTMYIGNGKGEIFIYDLKTNERIKELKIYKGDWSWPSRYLSPTGDLYMTYPGIEVKIDSTGTVVYNEAVEHSPELDQVVYDKAGNKYMTEWSSKYLYIYDNQDQLIDKYEFKDARYIGAVDILVDGANVYAVIDTGKYDEKTDTYQAKTTIQKIAGDKEQPLPEGFEVKTKIWTITFNAKVDPASLKQEHIYVKDAAGNTLKTTLVPDKTGKKVLVRPPVGNYKPGDYTLVVEKTVKSANDKQLTKQSDKKFSVQ